MSRTKKTRKYFSLLAILLMVIFAVGCVFMTACGNKDDDEKETTPEHTHSYTAYGYDEDNHWMVCPDDNEVDESSVTGHTWTVSTVTEATCKDYASTSYTCVCGATKTENGTEYGDHEYKVVFTWEEDETEGYTATAAYTCSVCGEVDSSRELVVVVEPETKDNGDVVYTATATLEDVTVGTDTKTVYAVVEPVEPDPEELPVSVDFSNPETFTWITYRNPADSDGVVTLDVESTYTNGILTIHTTKSGSTQMSINGEQFPNGLNMAGKTESSGGTYYKYIEINLEDYVDSAVSVSVKMNGNGDGTRSLYLTSSFQYFGNTGDVLTDYLAVAASENKAEATLSKTVEITESCKTLYLVCNNNVNIYTIDIAVDEDYVPGTGEGGEEGDAAEHKNSFSYSELTAKVEAAWAALPEGNENKKYQEDNTTPDYDKFPLAADMFDGSNEFLKFTDNQKSNQYRTSNSCFEINSSGTSASTTGSAMSVTFIGKGTITISFSSTGGSSWSNFGLLDASGNFVKATSYTVTNTDENETAEYTLETGGETSWVYKTYGTSFATVTFDITEAGTYYFFSAYLEESNSSYSNKRGCRINGVTMTDCYEEVTEG